MEEIKKGGISVETEHIFPIIKKWLYSEKEIFLRELVSNAADAVTKLQRLASLGKYEKDDAPYRVDVSFNKTEKTLTVTDNGIGMTAEEVEKYLCNMALSGALEFIKKYEGENEKDAPGIIGHFGLGFYSAFMVADKVEVFTKSFTGAPAVHFTCSESGEYEIEGAEERPRGSAVVLHLNEEGEEYLNEYKLKEVLEKYCSFMSVEIYLTDEEKEEEPAKEGEEKKAPSPINDIHPLWTRPASECTEQDYKDFYTKVFHDFREPLFYMHIQADYPLNFKGVLYFPRLRERYENLEGQIKLYYNQVFVADNIKEVIPEYLLMLRGVLDCPELPLNVSRSYLQNSGYVSKISAHIVKKVADKLNAMYNTEKEKYEGMWPDLKTFVEYGCIRDRKFYDRVSSCLLYTLTDGTRQTLDAYLEKAKEKHEGVVYYATDPDLQSQYISLYNARGIDVVLLDGIVDEQFIQAVESYKEGTSFKRVDADASALTEGEGEKSEKLTALFSSMATESMKLTVKTEKLADENVPAVLNIPEENRRMENMMKLYGAAMPGMPVEATLVVNTGNPIIKRLEEDGYGENADSVAKQVFSLALLSQRPLSAAERKDFLSESYRLLEKL